MTDFTALLEQARGYAAASYARNTQVAYASDWRQFKAWCEAHQRRPLPAMPETVLGYAVAAATRLSIATIDRHLSSISFYHRQERLSDPTEDPEVQVMMRGLRRTKGTAPAAKAPITVALLREMVAVQRDTLRGSQARAILVLGFAGAFRRGELVALTVADLADVPDGLVVTLRRSKTDQEGAGQVKGIPRGTDPTCAVCAVRAWLARASISEGWVFRALDAHGRVREAPLPPYAVGQIVQRTVAQLGLDPKEYGGHSLRAGLVTAAAKAGVGERIIMRQTGHSDVRTLRRYIRDGELFRENAAAAIGL